LWHAGTRFDYLYRTALPYGTAVISMATGYEPAKAFHVYTALFYCVGIAGVYLLIRIGMGSRGQPGWPREPRLCCRRRTPEKFVGVLPVLYDDHQGNAIYRVPRRWPARARVVDTSRLDSPLPFIGQR
jgi:hypothetical protein